MAKRYYWLNKHSREFLKRGYLLEGVTPEDRIRQIAERAEQILNIEGFADKFEDYMSKGYFSLSSPIWANFGLDRGLPISCNGSYIGDSMDSILETQAEVGMLTKHGAGTAGYFGDLRPRGSKIRNNGESSGAVHFMKLFDTLIDVVSQGNVRRGNFAAYLPIDHDDIEEFLEIKSDGNDIQNIFFAVCIPDYWMEEMIEGDEKKRAIWAKVLQKRTELGLPYLLFTDTVNNNKPQVYKDKNMLIKHSQLCSEILEYTDKDKTFVCDLASINVLHADEIMKTDAVFTMTLFLDAVLTEYIEKTKDISFLQRAHKFAKEHRSIGLGVLGWHSYLQSKHIPFESLDAKFENAKIFKHIQEESIKASKFMAIEYGEPEMLKGYGLRNTTLQAVAPTKSSSFILGQVSPSIEPLKSNYYLKDLAKSKTIFKNPFLVDILKQKDRDNKETWDSIKKQNGSVQHLDFLTDEEKNVFKTFSEISQLEIIQQAAQRQKFIDQSQSLNLMIHPDTDVRDINKLYIEAWKLGVKTLYYQYNINAAQALNRNLLNCSSCEA